MVVSSRKNRCEPTAHRLVLPTDHRLACVVPDRHRIAHIREGAFPLVMAPVSSCDPRFRRQTSPAGNRWRPPRGGCHERRMNYEPTPIDAAAGGCRRPLAQRCGVGNMTLRTNRCGVGSQVRKRIRKLGRAESLTRMLIRSGEVAADQFLSLKVNTFALQSALSPPCPNPLRTFLSTRFLSQVLGVLRARTPQGLRTRFLSDLGQYS